MSEPVFRNVSDTAVWVAMYRAQESERPDPLFRDPYARRLAGARGEAIGGRLETHSRNAWAFITRTILFDRFITNEVARGVDTVINLAAGLDARPYRMELPADLRWIEIDLPEILEHKASVMRGEMSRCALERVALDLSDVAAWREILARIDANAKKVLLLSEGLLIYFEREAVAAIAEELSGYRTFERWVVDVASPGVRDMMNRQVGGHLSRANAMLKFAPEEGPRFFEAHGWRVAEVQSMLKNGRATGRQPFFLRLVAMLPEPDPLGPQGKRPWSAVTLLENARS